MFEKEVEDGLKTVGSGETKRNVRRWLLAAGGLTAGEAVMATALGFALASFGKEWPESLLVGVGVVYHVLTVAFAIVLFRRVKRELGRDGEPALPLWLLKGFGPFLFGPYVLLPAIMFGKQVPHPALWIACVLIFASVSWLGALTTYLAALWLRAWVMSNLETVTFTPVEVKDIPAKSRRYLDAMTREFEALGFERIGDFRQKQCERQFARIFSGADGKFIGEAVSCESQRMQASSLVSLLADGTYIESSGIEIGAVPFAPEKLVMRGGAGDTLAELLQNHGATVQSECATRDTEPVRIPADQVELVSHYGLWLSHESLVAQRILTENPYDPLLEGIRAGLKELLPELVEA